MRAHRQKITIPDNHEVTVRLPSDLPAGDAELIVLTEALPGPGVKMDIATWLDGWIRSLPSVPVLPLEAFNRENLYE